MDIFFVSDAFYYDGSFFNHDRGNSSLTITSDELQTSDIRTERSCPYFPSLQEFDHIPHANSSVDSEPDTNNSRISADQQLVEAEQPSENLNLVTSEFRNELNGPAEPGVESPSQHEIKFDPNDPIIQVILHRLKAKFEEIETKQLADKIRQLYKDVFEELKQLALQANYTSNQVIGFLNGSWI